MLSGTEWVKAMRWFHENHAELVPSQGEGFPAHWMLFDGSFFLLSTIEDCADFAEVREMVLGGVPA